MVMSDTLTPTWTLGDRLRKARMVAGIGSEQMAAHMLRHWFATEVYEASGADLRMTQELLGHSSPTTTAMYTRWSRSRSVDVVASMTA